MNSYWLGLFTEAGIAALAAWGLGIALRAGLLSVGHAALFGVGGYAAGWLAIQGTPMVIAAILGSLIAGLMGLVFAGLTLRLSHLFFALATLVFGEILRVFASGWGVVGAEQGLIGIPLVEVLPMVTGILAIVIMLEFVVIRGSRIELLAELLATDDSLVELTGSSPRRLRLLFFSASAAVVGLAGSLAAFYRGLVQPAELGFDPSMMLLVFVIVGGAASGYGPIVAALVLTLLPDLLGIEGHFQAILLGVVLIASLLWKPKGVFQRYPIRFFSQGSPLLARRTSS